MAKTESPVFTARDVTSVSSRASSVSATHLNLRTNQPALEEYPQAAADWYAYVWYDRASRPVFRIAGWWPFLISGLADPHVCFGVAAEMAWTQYRLDAVAAELAVRKRATLDLAKGGRLRLGRGVLELETGGKVRRWDRRRQPQVVQAGWLRLRFDLANDNEDLVGVCILPLRDAADARLILMLLWIVVLFDMHSVEGSETHWGGRTLGTSESDGVTNPAWLNDPRVIAFREQMRSQERSEEKPPPASGEET